MLSIEKVVGIIKNVRTGEHWGYLIEEPVPPDEYILIQSKTPPTAAPGGQVVKVNKESKMTTDLEKRIEKMLADYAANMRKTTDEAIARLKKSQEERTPPTAAPAVNGLPIELRTLPSTELYKSIREGKLTVEQYNQEIEWRKKNPGQFEQLVKKAEFAQDLATAEGLAAQVRKQYLAERDKAKAELIKKSALDSSIEKMGQYQVDLSQSGLSREERASLTAALDREVQFQEELLGGPAEVAKYYLEYTSRPKIDDRTAALNSLEQLAKAGDVMAQSILKSQEDERQRKENPYWYAIQKSKERVSEEERAAQLEWIQRSQYPHAYR